ISLIVYLCFCFVRHKQNIKYSYSLSLMFYLLMHSMFDFILHLPIIMILFLFSIVWFLKDNSILLKEYNVKEVIRHSVIVFNTVLMLILFIILSSETLSFFKQDIAAAEINPVNSKLWETLYSENLISQNRALEYIDKAVKNSPNNGRLYLKRALIFGDNYLNYKVEDLKKCIELEPYNPFAKYCLANIYFNMNEPDMSIDNLKKALFLEPNYLDAHFLLGLNFIKIKRYTAGISHLDFILNFKKTYKRLSKSNYEKRILGLHDFNESQVYNLLSRIYFIEQNYQESKNMMEAAINLEPENKGYQGNLRKIIDEEKRNAKK
ncbi:tetratricopeptide repeat protein, partial [bacterium]